MVNKQLFLFYALGVCLPVLCTPDASTADEAIKAPVKRPQIIMRSSNPGEVRIESALNDTTTMEFIETPLTDVCDFLADLHNIPIKIDNRALRAADIEDDVAVTANLKNVTLKSALKLLLQAEGLAYVVQHESLVITTPDAASKSYSAKVYDISVLIPADGGEDAVTADAIAETVSAVVAAGTWVEGEGKGSVKAVTINGRSLLAINQTYDAHEKIMALLTDLQSATRR